MDQLEFLVQGSAEEPYKVVFRRRGPNNIDGLCNCGAGINGTYCKHRFQMMNGEVKNLVSGNEDDLVKLSEMLKGSDVEAAYNRLIDLEAQAAKLKKAVNAAKKELAYALRH
ncbi:hypothetical protein [Thalassospira sp.]|uniref:hypothetical protein n=1 Tax=Thalassospira sp. TaxID=1912094 RepID=UPI001B163E1D|nr:hypothetical protein [Thalassospira sp.]MBO6805771.1 hypothetical protein [Thalassospira sp.]MBO6841385.1 hypothetical protein [Thalassospira sp.]